ncbi:MAG TPA: hypothetical protein VJZ00_11795 [Thermoanaerobaculia bacterium]|nr:hypothetical protein [Thermoanaerobaculia bacterium]
MRSLLPLLFCAVFGVGLHADVPQVRVPADGAMLRGGSYASLDWSASALPAGTEEWEAFLSVDDGGYYAFRITPHLDIERRTFTWLVPNVDATSAKILIRTGDEKRETHFVIPGSFRIVRDPNADAPRPALLGTEGAESAREGEEEVVSWARGDRAGVDVTIEYAKARTQATLESRTRLHESADAVESQSLFIASTNQSESRDIQTKPTRRAIRSHRRTIDHLLTCRRLNI